MSTVSLRDLGAKEYEISIHLSLSEAARIGRERLVGSGATIRYAHDGSVSASLRYYVGAKGQGDELVRLMLCFGQGGAFEDGAEPATDIFIQDEASDLAAAEEVISSFSAWKEIWDTRWKREAARSLQAKLSRIEILRHIRSLFGDTVSESLIRSYLIALLQKRYKSQLFAETCLQRMGWPELREPQTATADLSQTRSIA